MTHHAFSLAGIRLHALASGALHLPDQGVLVVADLHFGKSERLARRGGSLLPPYDTRATLGRLDADLDATGARTVICLGDSFDDTAAAGALDAADALWLTRLIAGRDWTWISGNHDPGPVDLAGSYRAEVRIGPVAFRHIAVAETPEVSAHYHPKARFSGRGCPCFLADAHRVILPAYGTYTGGLWSDDPVFADLLEPGAIAILTGTTARAIPARTAQSRPRASTFSR